ncbi:hypothetical protein [Streptococcus anginosus]|uniref:hypothetical protein n=1 Tax=Streptococcus anginosus TaxID=1328 RepID=UPI0020007FC1|nr:hypothetical protein [Streptococcus anginosus]
MSKQVKDILATHNTDRPNGIIFAIHQNKQECIALFERSGWPDLKTQFLSWNEEVKNRTGFHSENDLLNAYVCKIWEVTDDWVCIELLPF